MENFLLFLCLTIEIMETKDSVRNVLNDGDTIILSKTLKVKGMSKILKRGRLKIFVLSMMLKILNVG